MANFNSRPLAERFWEKVNKHTLSGCWEWIGGKTHAGYGAIWHKGTVAYAHRISYEFAHGSIPADKLLMHLCDNPPCCNPEHLKPGTDLDNLLDAQSKGRLKRSAKRRLSADEIRRIQDRLRMGVKHGIVGQEFGLCLKTIGRIYGLIKQERVLEQAS